ncbi:hypothetical protein PAXINDRAFT_100160 [Paxillus involutus ATCC 200175]|uniref:C2H2-type domain-containing protein n=1 Tax=Paxillus involutus ATCC 200175 TaxID=664439 RepID=A0A0C9TFN1_PAXIN|nr:hypothetical protein PAXINDRAFT_100160 [Paxillus involutus ATCC 200175]
MYIDDGHEHISCEWNLSERPHWNYQLAEKCPVPPSYSSALYIKQASEPSFSPQTFPGISTFTTRFQAVEQCRAHMGDPSCTSIPIATGTSDLQPPTSWDGFVPSPELVRDLAALSRQTHEMGLCGRSCSLEEIPVASNHINPQLPSMTDAHSCDALDRQFFDYQTPFDRTGTLAAYSTLPNVDDASTNDNSHALPSAQAQMTLLHASVPSSIRQPEILFFDELKHSVGTGNAASDLRTYQCLWSPKDVPCLTLVSRDRRSVIDHLHDVHGVKPGDDKTPQKCLWRLCTKTMNKESIPRHILTVHLKEKAHCTKCGLSFAREDSLKRHLKGAQQKTLKGKEGPFKPQMLARRRA